MYNRRSKLLYIHSIHCYSKSDFGNLWKDGVATVIKIEALLPVRLKWRGSQSRAEKGPEKSQFNYFIFKRLSRAIFFKGTHVSQSFPVEINHFTGFSMICMKGKANSHGYLHRGASFSHNNAIKENWTQAVRGHDESGGLLQRGPAFTKSTAVKLWNKKKIKLDVPRHL